MSGPAALPTTTTTNSNPGYHQRHHRSSPLLRCAAGSACWGSCQAALRLAPVAASLTCFLSERRTAPLVLYCPYRRLLDTDSYLYRDPYKYVKVPPYKDIKWMTLSDNGATLTNGAAAASCLLCMPPACLAGACPVCRARRAPFIHARAAHPLLCVRAGGASYIQNAAPGGGAAWTIAYAAERMIRVNEDWKKWAANANISDDGHLGHAMMDQARPAARAVSVSCRGTRGGWLVRGCIPSHLHPWAASLQAVCVVPSRQQQPARVCIRLLHTHADPQNPPTPPHPAWPPTCLPATVCAGGCHGHQPAATPVRRVHPAHVAGAGQRGVGAAAVWRSWRAAEVPARVG